MSTVDRYLASEDSIGRFVDLKLLYNLSGIGLFTGLGVSCGSGLPTWEVIAQRVTAHISGGSSVYQELRTLGYTVPAILSWASERLNRDSFRERLREALYQDLDLPLWTNESGSTFRDKVRTVNPTLAAVGAFTTKWDGESYSANDRVKAILTTNVDTLLREYTARAFDTPILRSCERASAIPVPRRINIYYLHGMIRYDDKRQPHKEAADKLIFTDLEYHSVYREISHIFTYTPLFLFREYPFLFIGSGMTDDNVRRLLYWSKAEITKAEAEEGCHSEHDWMHYALLKAPEKEYLRDIVDDLLRPVRVLPIWYRQHEQLPHLLQHLYDDDTAWTKLIGIP